MTKQLYEEALADVKKLKEVAEDNAKRALLEAVTPRIRDLIENQLMGNEIAVSDDNLLMDEVPMSASSIEDGSNSAAAISMPDIEGKVTLDLDALKTPGEDSYELSMESAIALGLLQTESSSFERKILTLDRKIQLFKDSGKLVRESSGYADTVQQVISEVENMYSHLQNNMKDSELKSKYESILENHYSNLNELMEQNMKRINRLSEADVTLKLTGLPDEIDLDSVGVDLITGEDEEDGEEGEEGGDEDLDLGGDEEGGEGEEEGGGEEGGDEDLDLGGDEGSEEGGDEEESEEGSQMESRRLSNNLVVEIDENMLRREIKRMRTLREADETKPQSWGHGPGKVSDEFEDDNHGDPFVDIDLREQHTDEADMDEADMDEADMDELDQVDEAEDTKEYGGRKGRPLEQSQKQGRQPGTSMTQEGIRRRLAAEARLQSEAKQKATQAKKQQAKKQQEAQQAKKQSQQKMKEAQDQAKAGKKTQAQQNKKVAQKKAQEAQQKNQQGKKMQEAYNFFARKFNESVARSRRLQGMLNEASRSGSVDNGAPARSAEETSNLRNKLAETNLFNAKLLFTNKLLQNESLTKRQKAEVIERLDEAKSEREVKLVYESLVKTLQGSSRSTVSESVNRGVVGSSSRPQTSAAATLNEGVEADRWARLAGIVK